LAAMAVAVVAVLVATTRGAYCNNGSLTGSLLCKWCWWMCEWAINEGGFLKQTQHTFCGRQRQLPHASFPVDGALIPLLGNVIHTQIHIGVKVRDVGPGERQCVEVVSAWCRFHSDHAPVAKGHQLIVVT